MIKTADQVEKGYLYTFLFKFPLYVLRNRIYMYNKFTKEKFNSLKNYYLTKCINNKKHQNPYVISENTILFLFSIRIKMSCFDH